MQLADRLTLDAPRRTADGYLAVRAKAARAGVYDYAASEVGAPKDKFQPTDTVKVYRPAEEVFAHDSVASFLMKPITNDHPSVGVNASNWRDHARGVVGKALRDGDHLAFDLVLMDQAAIAAVDAGKCELSNGYACELTWGDGVAPDGTAYHATQTNIRGNHVALVDRGRAGPDCRIGDRFALCDALPAELADFTKEPTMKIKIGDAEVDATNGEAVRIAVDALNAKLTASDSAKTSAETQVATLTTDKATLEAQVATLQTQLADAKLTPAKLRDAAKAYATVCDKAKALGVTVSDEMDEPAIMKAVVSGKIGDAAKDWNDAQIAASFATLTADVKANDAGSIVNINPALNVGDAEADYAKARDTLKAELSGAWKPASAQAA